MRVCGRWFDAPLRDRIMGELAAQPALSRNALAAKLCGWMSWHNARGQPQLASARKALSQLDRCGAIRLPVLGGSAGGTARATRRPVCSTAGPAPPLVQLDCALATLGPVELVPVDSAELRAVYTLLMQHHPLGEQRLCGAQLRYLFRCAQGWLGAAAFQGASFALMPRDQWIGWSENVRRGNLARVVCNARFLVLPSVRVPHLASHLLAQMARALPEHWQQRYGVRPLLLETYVDPAHDGTCYKAAGWACVGHSAGRRDGVRKAVWVRALQADAAELLRHGPALTPRECPDNPQRWAETEFGALQVWDTRLKRRAFDLAEDFFGHAQARSLSRRCAQRARTVAAYRFFQNPKISMQTLLEAHREAVIGRMRAHPVVLVPQDTTFLNYSAHPGTQGLGPIGAKLEGGPIGLVLHNSHAFTPQGVPLGVVSADCWARDPAEHGSRRAPDERESRKWLDAWRVLQEIAPRVPETQLVSIGDREADLFELFALAREPASPRLLVRASQSRQRRVATQAGQEPFWAHVQGLPVAGRTTLNLPRRGSRRARDAVLQVRYAPVRVSPPKDTAGEPVDLWAVHLREEAAPVGIEPVEWMLLTNVPTATLDDALERARWYGARWGIEVFHRTLKTGCQIEDRQLGYAVRLENCLAIDLVVAWRIFHLTMLGRMEPNAPCTVFFSNPEWKALYRLRHETAHVPKTPPTLREATLWVGIEGGFQGRKSDGHPGTEALWHGLQQLDVAVRMYLTFLPHERHEMRTEYPLDYLQLPAYDSS